MKKIIGIGLFIISLLFGSVSVFGEESNSNVDEHIKLAEDAKSAILIEE